MRRLVIAGNWKMYKNNSEAVPTLGSPTIPIPII